MAAEAPPNERPADLVLSALPMLSPPESDHQRGRKRRQSPAPFLQVTSMQLPSGESATFRGRSRHRSTSRVDASRNTSRLRGGSLSSTRRRLLRVVRLDRHRSQSPSRSRSPNTQEPSKRRRQRTRSRSREHIEKPSKAVDHFSLLRHEIVIGSESVSFEDKHDGV